MQLASELTGLLTFGQPARDSIVVCTVLAAPQSRLMNHFIIYAQRNREETTQNRGRPAGGIHRGVGIVRQKLTMEFVSPICGGTDPLLDLPCRSASDLRRAYPFSFLINSKISESNCKSLQCAKNGSCADYLRNRSNCDITKCFSPAELRADRVARSILAKEAQTLTRRCPPPIPWDGILDRSANFITYT